LSSKNITSTYFTIPATLTKIYIMTTTPTQPISGFVGKFLNYEKALNKLHYILELYRQNPENEIYQDSLIKRYEFTWEMAWKTLNEYMEEIGLEVLPNPKLTLIKAFQINLISDNTEWQNMADDRNKSAHEYDESEAKNIANRIINQYNKALGELYFKLKQIYDTEYNGGK
jgi:nucleotidyltransferase substrate binding protein (TIGR01987 family)